MGLLKFDEEAFRELLLLSVSTMSAIIPQVNQSLNPEPMLVNTTTQVSYTPSTSSSSETSIDNKEDMSRILHVLVSSAQPRNVNMPGPTITRFDNTACDDLLKFLSLLTTYIFGSGMNSTNTSHQSFTPNVMSRNDRFNGYNPSPTLQHAPYNQDLNTNSNGLTFFVNTHANMQPQDVNPCKDSFEGMFTESTSGSSYAMPPTITTHVNSLAHPTEPILSKRKSNSSSTSSKRSKNGLTWCHSPYEQQIDFVSSPPGESSSSNSSSTTNSKPRRPKFHMVNHREAKKTLEERFQQTVLNPHVHNSNISISIQSGWLQNEQLKASKYIPPQIVHVTGTRSISNLQYQVELIGFKGNNLFILETTPLGPITFPMFAYNAIPFKHSQTKLGCNYFKFRFTVILDGVGPVAFTYSEQFRTITTKGFKKQTIHQKQN